MLLIYNIGVRLYFLLALLISPFNRKAKLWSAGRMGWLDRLPKYGSSDRVIWVHASSVGEFEQAKPLLRHLKKIGGLKIHVTFFSPSGYEVCKDTLLADSVSYLPLDTAKNYRLFLELLAPEVLFLTKYDFWYHMIHACNLNQVPVISYASIFRSDQAYFKKEKGFWIDLLKMVDVFYVQNEKSQTLLRGIDIPSKIIGDTRFDQVEHVSENRKQLSPFNDLDDSPIVVLGSAWEQDMVLWIPIINDNPKVKFVIAPHEIEGGVVSQVKKAFGDRLSVFSNGDPFSTQVYLLDTYGFLSSLYYYSDLAYVGGGFNSSGVHNTLEAAVYGVPIIIGPNYSKFQEVTDLIALGGLKSIRSNEELVIAFRDLLDRKNEAGSITRSYAEKHLGATNRMLEYLQQQGVWKV
jgi:3-deoxy-D-manno-octulosonic-acid transferase